MTDIDYTEVLPLRAQGLTQQQIADRLGVSRSTICRILAAGAPTDLGPGPRAAEVEALAARMGEIDDAVNARLGLARALAAKLDQCAALRTAQSSVAAANLVKQFRDTLDELQPMTNTHAEKLHQALLGDVGSKSAIAGTSPRLPIRVARRLPGPRPRS
jgi:transcriptional regulator with XRE-family HTH domain